MLKYLLMCRSLTYAQRASRALEHAGITAVITKAPASATGIGCGYCVKISENKLSSALSILNQEGLGPIKIFVQEHDGSVSEVSS